MSELLMMEAALFQLRAAVGDDPLYVPIRIGADILANAVAGAKEGGVNAARVNDIEFALNDLVAAIDDTGAPDEVYRAVALLQNDAASLRAASALPVELTKAMHALQAKLKARAKAMERGQYRAEGTDLEPLPHPPQELREDAIPIVRQLTAEGFDMPALESLLTHPEELRYHTLNEIADELEVVLGG